MEIQQYIPDVAGGAAVYAVLAYNNGKEVADKLSNVSLAVMAAAASAVADYFMNRDAEVTIQRFLPAAALGGAFYLVLQYNDGKDEADQLSDVVVAALAMTAAALTRYFVTQA